MKKLFIGLVALGAVYALLKKQGPRREAPPSKLDINQWEGEGGAIPSGGDQTASQVQPTPGRA